MTNISREPVWLSLIQTKMLHAESLAQFGGSPGIRDEALLESALDRPRNKWSYRQSESLFELAAAYGFGIAKNHAFVDGNKRTALLAMRVFLFRNGFVLEPEEIETVAVIEGLADGSVNEVLLAEWIESNSKKR